MPPAINAEMFHPQERRGRKEIFGYKPKRTQSTRSKAATKNLSLAEPAENTE